MLPAALPINRSSGRVTRRACWTVGGSRSRLPASV